MSTLEERPWERPGEVRRDAESHRGQLLVVLGTVSVACGLSAFLLLAPALFGLPVGAAALAMARRDLRKMRAGLMDCRGIDKTGEGRALAAFGLILNLVAPLAVAGMVLLRHLTSR
jgi:hypothetical protein